MDILSHTVLKTLTISIIIYHVTSFDINIDNQGKFILSINTQTWLIGSDIYMTCGWKKYSVNTDNLKLYSYKHTTGLDSLGQYELKSFTFYASGDSCKNSSFVVSYKVYVGHDTVVFGQYFQEGVQKTSIGDAENVMTGFPSFYVNRDQDLGYLAYGGMMFGDKRKAFGRWHKGTQNIVSGLESGPLVLFNRNNSALIMSSFINPMAGSTVYQSSGGSDGSYNNTVVTWGLMGAADEIPKGFVYSTVLHYSSQGINKAFEGWGNLVRKHYNKDRKFTDTDFINNYIGYWTASGAYYYYKTVTGKNYQDTILDIYQYSQHMKIPYRYIEYDSWWYPKGKDGGVTEWTALKEVFPNGLEYMWSKTRWPVIAHNRWWSSATTYAKQNGGQYDFVVEKNTSKHSLPNDTRFWNDLLGAAKEWGVISYEQDWLNLQFDLTDATRQSLTLGRTWLLEMGLGAMKNAITIQYCMSPPRHALQSLEIPVVTQGRVSDDYKPGNSEWRIGVTSIFAYHLGVAPFKDNFWTTTNQTGNPYNLEEPYPALESVVSTLSTGPVAPGDMIGASDVNLIMKSCNTDGLILKPDRPALAIDKQIMMKSYSNFTGEVWTTYSVISNWTFGIVFAAGFANGDKIEITPQDIYGHTQFHNEKIYSVYKPTSTDYFSTVNTLTLTDCGLSHFCLYYTTPVILFKDKELLLLGELDKWVVMTGKRIGTISVSGEDVLIYFTGGSQEKVTFSYIYGERLIVVHCILSDAGSAVLSVVSETCL